MEFNKQQKALLYTLLYSDIFDFPLTEKELWLDLISEKKIDKNTIKKTAKSLSKLITYNKGFFCMSGKEKTIIKRKKRIKIAKKKLKIAFYVAKYLSYIPTIMFIGISGRLSHVDADLDDDIDIFIITKNNTIWTTRMLTLFVLELMNVRRKREDSNPADKICPNLIIEESNLSWPIKKRDLYTAHEITHLIPVFERNNMYRKFLAENDWISKFYPNRKIDYIRKNYLKRRKSYLIIKTISFILTFRLFEYTFGRLQKIYMRKKRKNEVILKNFLAFHPRDYRQEILNDFASKVKKYESGAKLNSGYSSNPK